MDQCSAIYFRFPSASQDSENVTDLAVNPGAASNIDPSFSLREIIVFLCYRSLAARDIEFRNFSDPSTTSVATDCQELFHQNPAPPQDVTRRVQPNATKPQQRPPPRPIPRLPAPRSRHAGVLPLHAIDPQHSRPRRLTQFRLPLVFNSALPIPLTTHRINPTWAIPSQRFHHAQRSGTDPMQCISPAPRAC